MAWRRSTTSPGSRLPFHGHIGSEIVKNALTYLKFSAYMSENLIFQKPFLSYRNTRTMSLCLQAAFGVHPVMSLIKLWKAAFCLSWMWEIGLSLITWEQILSMNHLLLMISRDQLFITWCHSVIGKVFLF